MGREEHQHAATEVPSDLVLVEVAPRRLECLTLCVNDPDANDAVGANTKPLLPPERDAQHHIAERGEYVAAAEIGLAKEIGTVSEVSFDPDDAAAHPREAGAPVEAACVNCVAELTVGLAAEVPADERNEEPVGPSRGG